MIALSTADSRFERIHQSSLMLLERCGLHLGAATALLKLCRQLGLKTDSDRVYFTATQIEKALAQVPRSFRLMARNLERSLDYCPDTSFIGMGRSAAFVFDESGRRRQATGHDFIDMMKLGQQLEEIKLVGNLVTPADIVPERVNDFMMAAQIRYSDKPYHLLHASDLPLLCEAFQIEPGALVSACEEGRVYAHTTVNTMSPLAISSEQSDHLLVMAQNGIAINISPAPAMGSSSPCTIAGTLAVNNAEILAVLVIIQLIRPGLPVLYGVFPSGTDMRSMAATFGSAEARLLEQEAVRMANYYGLLTRGNVGLNEAFDCDFQAGAEAMFNFSEALRSNINYLPGCGLLASFAGASKAKLVMDAELVSMLQRYRRPWTATDEDLAIDLTCQVGPKGSFIMQPHTYSRCRSELHHPKVFCRSSFEKWRDGENLVARAERHADHLIAEFRIPPLPRSVEQRIIPLLT